MSQLNESLKEAKSAEKEVRGEVAGVLREGRAAQQALQAAEAAAEKAVSGYLERGTAWSAWAPVGSGAVVAGQGVQDGMGLLVTPERNGGIGNVWLVQAV